MIKTRKNIEMSTDKGFVCEFRTLREAANCLVALGVTDTYTNAKSGISRAAHNYKNTDTYKGFNFKYIN